MATTAAEQPSDYVPKPIGELYARWTLDCLIEPRLCHFQISSNDFIEAPRDWRIDKISLDSQGVHAQFNYPIKSQKVTLKMTRAQGLTWNEGFKDNTNYTLAAELGGTLGSEISAQIPQLQGVGLKTIRSLSPKIGGNGQWLQETSGGSGGTQSGEDVVTAELEVTYFNLTEDPQRLVNDKEPGK